MKNMMSNANLANQQQDSGWWAIYCTQSWTVSNFIIYLFFVQKMHSKIFVGGLTWNTTKEMLYAEFSKYGEIVDSIVMKNPETGNSRGFGFVTYKDNSAAENAVNSGSHRIDGKIVSWFCVISLKKNFRQNLVFFGKKFKNQLEILFYFFTVFVVKS